MKPWWKQWLGGQTILGPLIVLLVVVAVAFLLLVFKPSIFHIYVPFFTLAFTGVLAVGTLYVAAQTRQATTLTKESLDLARQEFIATHRPKLRVRNVTIRSVLPEKPIDPYRPFKKGDIVRGELYVVNVGDTPATVGESHCIVTWRQGLLPMERPYEADTANNFLRTPILRSGESIEGRFHSSEMMADDVEDYCMSNYKKHLWVMGWIEYTDDLGSKRRCVFCREWHGESQNFVPVGNIDYEHEE